MVVEGAYLNCHTFIRVGINTAAGPAVGHPSGDSSLKI